MTPSEKAAHHDRVEHLKNIFTLIYPHLTTNKNSGSKNLKNRTHEERKTKMQKWLSDMEHAVSQKESPWGEQRSYKSLSLLPRFMQLLRECILTHQWTQVSAMLNCVSHIPYGADWTIWKANLAALYTEPEDNLNLIQDFFKHSYLLRECNVRDVVLEFVQYLISQGRLQEASQTIQNSRKVRRGVQQVQQAKFTEHLIHLLDAYQGLIYYVEWKTALCKKSDSTQNTMSESFYDLTSVQGLSDEAVNSIAQRALLGLDRLQHVHGVWDIFLTKSVEIHEYYEEFEQAREVLRSYRERNPDNPNSHLFLYELLQRNCEHFDEISVQEESLSCLKSLAKLDPANPLVVTLCQRLTDRGDTTLSLRYGFDLLDTFTWQDKTEGWLCFLTTLKACLSRKRTEEEQEASKKELKRCWDTRQDWWPAYHFDPHQMNSSADISSSSSVPCEVLLAKSVAAAVLISRDCSYVQRARREMDVSSLQRLDGILSDIDWKVVKSFPKTCINDVHATAEQPTSTAGANTSKSTVADPLSHFDDREDASDDSSSSVASVTTSTLSVGWTKKHKKFTDTGNERRSKARSHEAGQNVNTQDQDLVGNTAKTSGSAETSESDSDSDSVSDHDSSGHEGDRQGQLLSGAEVKGGSEEEEKEEPEFFSPSKRRRLKH